MVELQIDHTAVSHTRIHVKDIHRPPEVASIRRLDPENPQHIEIARTLDLASPEVINPYTGDHSPMTEIQLKQWMVEEVYVISAQGSEEPVGYVYLYPDEAGRIDHIRKTLKNVSQDAQVTEFNFWAHKDAKPELVESGLRQALASFFADDVTVPEKKTEPAPPRYAFMYVEPDDMDDAALLGKIGAQYVGDVSYDTPGKTDGPMDRVYMVDVAHFAQALP